jgi:hypothetical protein
MPPLGGAKKKGSVYHHLMSSTNDVDIQNIQTCCRLIFRQRPEVLRHGSSGTYARISHLGTAFKVSGHSIDSGTMSIPHAIRRAGTYANNNKKNKNKNNTRSGARREPTEEEEQQQQEEQQAESVCQVGDQSRGCHAFGQRDAW